MATSSIKYIPLNLRACALHTIFYFPFKYAQTASINTLLKGRVFSTHTQLLSIFFLTTTSLCIILSMAILEAGNQQSLNDAKPAIPENDIELHVNEGLKQEHFDYSQRAQWLRAAILGANDGLVSTASLMMGVGAVREDIKAMILTGFAGLVAGACSMAIGEFVSVYSQVDIEKAQKKREKKMREGAETEDDESGSTQLPSPMQAAVASALSFMVGAVIPLLAAAFIKGHKVRLGVVAIVASFALVVFGGAGAVLGRAPMVKSCVRVLVGGWMAMAITFGLTKVIGKSAL